jgi:signal transduction histidine kinase
MFDRFVRYNASSSDKGSGLGLAISRSIVKLHRGTIVALAGRAGHGLRMEIELPRA